MENDATHYQRDEAKKIPLAVRATNFCARVENFITWDTLVSVFSSRFF
jgi:hypothetical protein